MANFTDTGISAPTSSGYKGGRAVTPPSRDPYAAPPNFGPPVPGQCQDDFQVYFDNVQNIVIPKSSLDVGAPTLLNQLVPVKGACIRAGNGTSSGGTFGGTGRNFVICLHWKIYQPNQYINGCFSDSSAVAGVSILPVPPSFLVLTGLDQITFESEFDQFYYSIFPATFPGPNTFADMLIQVYPCKSRQRL